MCVCVCECGGGGGRGGGCVEGWFIALKVYILSLLARGADVMAPSMALDWIWWIGQ